MQQEHNFKPEELLDPTASRMMPPQGFQVYFQSCVTLNSDLLTHKFDRFMPLPHDHLCQLSSTLVHQFANVELVSLTTEQAENIMRPFPA